MEPPLLCKKATGNQTGRFFASGSAPFLFNFSGAMLCTARKAFAALPSPISAGDSSPATLVCGPLVAVKDNGPAFVRFFPALQFKVDRFHTHSQPFCYVRRPVVRLIPRGNLLSVCERQISVFPQDFSPPVLFISYFFAKKLGYTGRLTLCNLILMLAKLSWKEQKA